MVLVVDDDVDLQDLVSMILEMSSFSVARAETGQAALQKLSQDELPSLVLLDLMLPDMRGEDVYRQMQNLQRTKGQVPVVIMSATAEGPSRAEELGVPFLGKPFGMTELVEVVEKHSQRSRSNV